MTENHMVLPAAAPDGGGPPNPGECAVCFRVFDLDVNGYWEFDGKHYCERHVPSCASCGDVPFGRVHNPHDWFGLFKTRHAEEPIKIDGKMYCRVCADDLLPPAA